MYRGTFPASDQSPSQWQNIASPLNGVKTEEATLVRQVSVKQRSARLSFLPGRKHSDVEQQETEKVNGSSESKDADSRSRSRSFGKANRQHAVFGTPSIEETQDDKVSDSRRRSSSAEKVSLERSSTNEDQEQAPVKRGGSVRKRLSLLRLGKKSSKMGGLMGSVDEE